MMPWSPKRLNPDAPRPLHTQVRRSILDAVKDGTLSTGSRLPGTRELAVAFGVNRLTVIKAVRFLENRGVLRTVAGKGVFVASERIQTKEAYHRPPERFFDGIAEGAVEADCLEARQETIGRFVARILSHKQISFAAGFPPPDHIPALLLRRTANRVMKDSSGFAPFSYAHPSGDPQLIAQIRSLLEQRGLSLNPDDKILITGGAEEAICLCLECFFNESRGLAIESPGYMGTIAACRQRAIPMCSVPVDHGGVHPSSLERCLKSGEAVGVYTVPTYQNPTGVTQQGRRREKLMALANRYEATIIEDDIYMDLRFGGRPIPPLKSLPGGDRVIYIGSFSKSLAPGFRLGYLIATGDRALTLKHHKETWNVSTNSLSQAIVSEFLKSGAYRQHLMRVRKAYKLRRDAMLDALDRHLGDVAQFTKPKGGMHLWVMLDRAVGLSRLEERAQEAGILFAPSNLFFIDGRKNSAFRLNFTVNPPDLIREGIVRLSTIIKQEMKS